MAPPIQRPGQKVSSPLLLVNEASGKGVLLAVESDGSLSVKFLDPTTGVWTTRARIRPYGDAEAAGSHLDGVVF